MSSTLICFSVLFSFSSTKRSLISFKLTRVSLYSFVKLNIFDLLSICCQFWLVKFMQIQMSSVESINYLMGTWWNSNVFSF